VVLESERLNIFPYISSGEQKSLRTDGQQMTADTNSSGELIKQNKNTILNGSIKR